MYIIPVKYIGILIIIIITLQTTESVIRMIKITINAKQCLIYAKA